MKKNFICLLIILLVISLFASCSMNKGDEPSSTPVSEPVSEEKSNNSQGIGGLKSELDSRTTVRFNWLGSTYVTYAEENLGFVLSDEPVDEGLWDILSMIKYLGLSKEDFIAVNDKNLDRNGEKEFTDEEIDILFGDDERAKREMVSPCCIFIGERPVTCDTPYYTALWYAEHSVDEWIEVGTPREDMIRLHDRLENAQIFDSYREAFEEKYKEFLDRVKE